MGAVLRVAVEVDPGVYLILAATDTPLTGEIFRRTCTPDSRADGLTLYRSIRNGGFLPRCPCWRSRLRLNNTARRQPHGACDT